MAVAYLSNDEFFDQGIPADALAGMTSATISAAILWASGVADSYLRKRYALPFVSYGADLKAAVADIAAFRLLRRRGYKTGSDNNDAVADGYEAAIKWLRDVATGLVQIECVDSTPEVDEEGSLSASAETPYAPVGKFSFFTSNRRRCTDDE